MIVARPVEEVLNSELTQWLQDVAPAAEEPYPIPGCKAVIAPSVPSVAPPIPLTLMYSSQDMLATLTRDPLRLGLTRV